MVYLFFGEDEHSKDIYLEKLKRQLFSKELEPFNYDVLYAKELHLLEFQEALKRLPHKAKKRIIIIRQADSLRQEIKDYFITYLKRPFSSNLIILDFREFDQRDEFIKNILKYAKVFHFHSREILDTFKLSKEIDRRRIKNAFKILNTLLSEGTEPEMILGGLRYCFQNSNLSYEEKKRRLSLLLEADLDIKTGRLKSPALALEKLIFNLCYF
jgi:DNA polymerase III delta subunit